MKDFAITASAALAFILLTGCNPSGLDVAVTGSGKVTSNDGTIACPTSCTRQSSVTGESITLHADPVAGNKFVGWGGACSGSAATCVVNINNATPTHVSATFEPLVLTVNQVPLSDDYLRLCVNSNYSPATAIADVVELNCEATPIHSLAGIQYFTALHALRIQGPNQLQDITPLTRLSNFSVLSLYGLSENLVHVQALAGIESFNELYIENAPQLICADLEAIRRKVGSQNVIIGNGLCP